MDQCNHKDHYKRKERGSESEKKMTTEAGVGVMWPGAQECGQPLESKEGKEIDYSPRYSGKNAVLTAHLRLLTTRTVKRSLCSFKPLNLW